MSRYFINKNAKPNGEHEIHKAGCKHLPEVQDRIFLGDYAHCLYAIHKAKRLYNRVNGCGYCSKPCFEK